MIKRVFVFCLIVISAINVMGQFPFLDSQKSKEALRYYNEGVQAYYRNDIVGADSLFRKSISCQVTKDALYNYSQTRMYLKDTCAACISLKIIYSRFKDVDATKHYFAACNIYSDTTYYDKSFKKMNTAVGYKYYEVMQNFRYDLYPRGEIHKKGHRGTHRNYIFELKSDDVDVCGSYQIIDSIKYYDFMFTSVFDEVNKELIADYSDKIKRYMNAKYDFSKIPENNRLFDVNVLVDNKGKIAKCTMTSKCFEVLEQPVQDEIIKDVSELFKNMPNLKPEKFLEEPVGKQYNITVYLWQ